MYVAEKEISTRYYFEQKLQFTDHYSLGLHR
jgi:hypothetical protein